MSNPIAMMFAGPNGAGKTTTAMTLFQENIEAADFVNADAIAQGLSGGNPDSVAIEAGAVMLNRLRQLADQRKNLAFETTGASRTFATWIKKLKAAGYEYHLCFLWLRDPDVAIARVAERVRFGGHHVPAETIRRRYDLGLQNFFKLYLPLATTWRLLDNNYVASPRPIAEGGTASETTVFDATIWQKLIERFGK